MTGAVRSVLIVGGGAAGWLTAALLARSVGGSNDKNVKITVIESAEIGTIGVGEGTFPTIRATLETLGIDEGHFLRGSTATFKQGVKFVDWEKEPVPDADGNLLHDHYLHPFEAPYQRGGLDLVPYWLLQDESRRAPFAEAVTFQKRVADAQRAPKRVHEDDYASHLSYAYHFDATSFARLIKDRACELGVVSLQGTIGHVEVTDDGAIGGVTCLEHGEIKADLYVDCSGFSALLIGKALKTTFRSIRSNLFADRAVTCQVPLENLRMPINSFTVATAREAGWIWDIGLSSRRGLGYVYSSDHGTGGRAEEVLRDYAGAKGADVGVRHIHFDPGFRETPWVGNCVAVGLSAGFLEPLESTGIVLIEIAARYIAEFLPRGGPVDAPAALFNKMMRLRNEKIINFLKLHYCLSKRTEPFWRDNAEAKSVPEDLLYLLEMWKYRPPARFDFMIDTESFLHFNYQYIMYGMGFKTDLSAARGRYPETAAAQKTFDRIRTFGRMAVRDLPFHRDLIDQVNSRNFGIHNGGLGARL